MSYATNVADMSREITVFVDRSLKGSRPTDLPVQLPTKFELVIISKRPDLPVFPRR